MKFVRIYVRVLALLGRQKRVAIMLALANLAIAATQFAEPVLFGGVIDTLTGHPGSWVALAPLLIASLAQRNGFGVAFATTSTALVLGALTWFWIPETRGRALH